MPYKAENYDALSHEQYVWKHRFLYMYNVAVLLIFNF